MFADDSFDRSMWIANFIHTVLFVLLALGAYFLGGKGSAGIRLHNNNNNTAPREVEYTSTCGRVAEAARIVRDTLIVLFIATVATEVGYGATNNTAILAWVGVVCSVIAAVAAASVNNPVVTTVILLPAYLFFLAVFGLAFRQADGKV